MIISIHKGQEQSWVMTIFLDSKIKFEYYRMNIFIQSKVIKNSLCSPKPFLAPWSQVDQTTQAKGPQTNLQVS